MRVAFFTQYQVDELATDTTPLQHIAERMPGASSMALRSHLGRFGLSGQKATTESARLSGGERARLALSIICIEAPHLLLLDEPTNHLDIDTREALIQALNDFGGAVVIVSHDRHLLEMVADRLIVVDGGTATPFDGTLEDYTAALLQRTVVQSNVPTQ